MRRYLLFFVLSAALFQGCGGKDKLPAHILGQEKMEAILWDMIRADLFITNYMVIKDSALDKQKQGIELYSLILKQHQVTQEKFRESFLYYRTHTLLLRELMDSLNHFQWETPHKRKIIHPDSLGLDTAR